jgi:predicted ArsR family transcriptional regulator
MEELVAELSADQRDALLSRVGRRLAAGALPSAGADLDARLEAAMGVLTALGGAASLEERDGVRVIRGLGCPLGAIVAHRPETCRVMEVLLAEILGHPVRQCCEHGERPRCCFEVRPAA